MISNETKTLAIEVGLRELIYNKPYFSVTQLKDLVKLAGVGFAGAGAISSDELTFFKVLHCVKYADMGETLRDRVIDLVQRIISRTSRMTLAVIRSITPRPPKLLAAPIRLLGYIPSVEANKPAFDRT